MEKKKSLPTKSIPDPKLPFSNKADGSMDYIAKDNKEKSKNSKDLNRIKYRDSRYT